MPKDAPKLAAILDHPLLSFSDHPADKWTIRNACEGTQIFGSTGSGKTSGSGRTLAVRFLKNGFGGLVLTAKQEERKLWEAYLQEAGRSREELVVLGPKEGLQFNFLDYEFARPDAPPGTATRLTLNLVSLLLTALSTGEGAVSTNDPFWNDALRELLTHAIDLADIGGAEVDLPELSAIIRSAPQSRSDIQSLAWRRGSRCFELLEAANAKADKLRSTQLGRYHDLEETVAYWLNDFPNLAEKSRSIILSSFTGKVAGLLRDPLRRMFCTGTRPEVMPSETHRGQIILLDLPVKEFGEVGRVAQTLYKTIWQRATERRSLTGNWRPVFLWADESQYFVTAEDMLFQQTARSKAAATVYLTQNLPNYYAALGSRNGNAATESLLGNLQTKIFHANGDPTTNEWAERVFARKLTLKSGYSRGYEHQKSGGGTSVSIQEHYEPIVPAVAFTKLRKGGVEPFEVEGIIFSGGRTWRGSDFGDDASAITVTFSQPREQATT